VILRGLEHYSCMRTWCLGTMDNLKYIIFSTRSGGAEGDNAVRRTLVWVMRNPLSRIRSRSHIIIGPWIWTGYYSHVKWALNSINCLLMNN
jgi:hypothetical protein